MKTPQPLPPPPLCCTDYFQQVNQSPNLTEKEALLEKIKVGTLELGNLLRIYDCTIQAVPECSDYDLVRLATWFTNRRQRLRLKGGKEQGLHPNNDNDSRKSSSPFTKKSGLDPVILNINLNRFPIFNSSCYPTSDYFSKQSTSAIFRATKNLVNTPGKQRC